MNLDELYQRVSEAILQIDFESIWRGFTPLRFALYDDEKCYFDGEYIEKTDIFCANTSIIYQGEPIAIWKVEEEFCDAVLTSKIVHEMFHAYQEKQGWDCWANEMEALYHYKYDAENMGIRLYENNILLSLLQKDDAASYKELLSYRKLRSRKYPYQYLYESKVEEIEGTATYVEWMTLRQLDKEAASQLEKHMRVFITEPDRQLPVRISCYYTGALLVYALLRAGEYSLRAMERPAACAILKNVQEAKEAFAQKAEYEQKASASIAIFHEKTKSLIEVALNKNEVVMSAPAEMVCVNVYDARFYEGYMTSSFFMMYRDAEGDKTIYGDFVIKMKNEKEIAAIYRLDETNGE